MKCKKHPRYKVKRQPTSNCEKCWQIWLWKSGKLKIAQHEYEFYLVKKP